MAHDRLDGPSLAQALYGAVEVALGPEGATPRRLPAATRPAHPNESIDFLACCAAGVRLELLTAATELRLVATLTREQDPAGKGPRFPAVFVAESDPDQAIRVPVTHTGLVAFGPDANVTERLDAGPSTLTFPLPAPPGPRRVRLWLPHTAAVTLHHLDANAPVLPSPTQARDLPRWVHHGSSISHCLEAPDPTATWPALAAASLGLDATNLAIAGNACLDPFVAEAIAATPADLVSVKVGINIVTADAMRGRVFLPALHGFVDTIRRTMPHTPILLIGPIACPAVEDAPGPAMTGPDGRLAAPPRPRTPTDDLLTLTRTRDLIQGAVEARRPHDDRLFYLDGHRLLGPEDSGLLPDGLHPSPAGYRLIAERFTQFARQTLLPLPATT